MAVFKWIFCITSANKAPGGFGFGDQLDFVQSRDGVTTYADFCGMIDGVVDTMPVNTAKLIVARGPTETGQYYGAHNMLAILNVGDTSASVTLTGLVPGLNGRGSRWRMVKAGGTWGYPEWINPPMDLNTEYRTTERYMGKPVYKKLVALGSAPSTKGTKEIFPFGEDYSAGTYNVFSVDAHLSNSANDGGWTITTPHFNIGGELVTDIRFSGVRIDFYSSGMTGYYGFVLLKYTKLNE